MTQTTIIPDAIAEAARWHLLALLLERPRPGWDLEIRSIAREVPDILLRSVADAADGATEGEYLHLLGPGGRVAAREVGHAVMRDPGWILADLARYYDAFGYAPRAEDPLDHVAVEVGFVAYLHLKEALARSGHDEDTASITREARDGFLREHLAPFAVSLARKLGPDEAGHLAGAADLLAARVPVVDPIPPFESEIDPLANGCGACVDE